MVFTGGRKPRQGSEMTKLARQVDRLIVKRNNKQVKSLGGERRARWIYSTSRIEYPEVRLEHARIVVREKK